MRARLAMTVAASAVLATSFARPAQAYVRALSDSGAPYYWPASCATVTIYLNGFTILGDNLVAKAVAAAAHAWSPSEVTCPGPDADGGNGGHPYFEIIPSLAAGGAVPGVGPDGRNSIIFQTTDWPDAPELIAFSQHFSRPDGEIIDTDIEINATSTTTWGDLDSPSGHILGTIDLQTALTHEFGHFIGLAHTCVNDGAPISKDDQGQPAPSCDDANVPQAEAVMWFEVMADSTAKRVLASDDVRAICAIYPSAQDPHACSANLPDDGCGCATGNNGDARATALGLLALGLAAGARRRRRLRSDRDRRAAL